MTELMTGLGVLLATGVLATTTGALEAAGAELAGALEAAPQSPLEMPNWVEYWYWPVTSSMIWRP